MLTAVLGCVFMYKFWILNIKWSLEKFVPYVDNLTGTFSCATTERCVGVSSLCNGDDDCGDRSDERDCGMYKHHDHKLESSLSAKFPLPVPVIFQTIIYLELSTLQLSSALSTSLVCWREWYRVRIMGWVLTPATKPVSGPLRDQWGHRYRYR